MSAADSGDRARQVAALAHEIREHLGEHNVLDALARELARSRLVIDDLGKRLDGTEKELAALKLAQRARDILLPKAELVYQGRKEAQIDASAPLPPERGFHALERDGNGTVFRWTGPTPQFHYDLHLDRSELLMFSLHVPLWGAEHAKGLSVSSDGRMIPLRRRNVGRSVVLDGVLQPRADVGLTRLDFAVERMQTVAAKTEGAAPRELGIPVLRLKVAPIDDEAFREWFQSVDMAGMTMDEARETLGAGDSRLAAAPKLAAVRDPQAGR